MTSPGRMAQITLLSALAAGCGARTDLDRGEAGGVDAARPPEAERCNGADDDTDGLVDEGFPAQTCGVGACVATVPGCVDGAVPTCRPAPPSDEVCNRLDDDCDGRADEGLPPTTLSDAITVRADGEGTTGDCPRCTRAYRPIVARTATGLQLYYLVDFLFMEPAPSLFHRSLDAEGRPTSPPALLFDDAWAATGVLMPQTGTAGWGMIGDASATPTLDRRSLSADGAVLDGRELEGVDPGATLIAGDADEAGAALVLRGGSRDAGHTVVWLDAETEVGGRWSPEDADRWEDVRVFRDGGVSWIVYVEYVDDRRERSMVQLRRLSCPAE